MILVTGATGNIGSEVRRLVEAKGIPLRLLARDPSKVGALPSGTEIVQGDLTKPETLGAAFKGVEKAFLVFLAGEHLPRVAPPVFEAARAAGVKHAVFVSSGTIFMKPEVAIGRWHLAAEEALKATGMAWTFLRPGNFSSNTLRWAPTIKSQGAVYAPGSRGASVPVDPRDIAAVGAAALTAPGHEGKVYGVTGSEKLTSAQQVEIIGQALGKPLRLVEVPKEGARAQMLKHGMSEVMVDAVLELTDGASLLPEHELITHTVREVTGKPPRTFAEWVRDNLDAFR